MKCDICHENNAVIFVRQVTNSSTKELYLCADCAEKKGITENTSNEKFSLGGLLGNIISNQNDEKNKVCSVCGRKFLHIQKEKTVGCAECYNVFSNEIKDILKGMGVTKKYSGDLPNRLPHFKSSLTDRAMLQEKLQKAIQEENYEKAAVYRDKLKMLDKQSIEEAIE